MEIFVGILELLWITIGWWLVLLAIGVLAMSAVIFFFRMIGFVIVQITDKY